MDPRRTLTGNHLRSTLAWAAARAAGGALASAADRMNATHDVIDNANANEPARAAPHLLVEHYPGLAAVLPWTPIGTFPTPIEELVPDEIPAGARLFVKRDDLASPRYGGNKVRKLEHILGLALAQGRNPLITLGGIGSNHALATAIHGAARGFETDLVLYDQPVTTFVRSNLSGFLAVGARLHHAGTIPRAFWLARRIFHERRRQGHRPYFIMVGGTSRLGCVGHVTAAFELAAQVARGEMPVPDLLYVPLGTCGTAAGLIAGLRMAGLSTRVVAVRVADPISANAAMLRYYAQAVADFLRRLEPSVPRLQIREADFEVLTDYYGPGYGYPTPEGDAALRWAAPYLALETTYTAKTLAACLDTIRRRRTAGTFLFWNTFSSCPFPIMTDDSTLPPSLRALLAAATPYPNDS